MNKPWLGLILLSLLLLAASAHASDRVYRWVDQDGVVHFSSSPPPDEQQAEEINLPRDQPMSGVEVLDDEDSSENEPPPPGEAEVRARNCEISRSNLAKLESAESALRTDPETGEQVEIRGEELQAAVRTTLEQIRQFCM